MTDEITPTAPEAAAATPVSESQPRDDAGRFASTPPAEPKADATTETPEEVKAETEEPEKKDEPKRNRVRERIDQLTAEKNAERRRADMLAQQLAKLQQYQPKPVDPDDWDGQQAERFRGVMREEQMQSTAAEFEAAQRRAQEIQYQTFQTKIEEARERIPDIDQAIAVIMSPQMPITQDMAELIVESDYTAELTHYLAKNPHEVYSLAQMTPAQQGRALARIEAKFNLPTKRTSTAPPPPPMVTGAQPPRERSPSEMSAAEYVAMRKAQWNGGR